jgi:hypothetical protein
MKRLIQLNLLLLLISTVSAQESQPQEPSPQQPTKILRVYDWKDLAQQHQLSGGEVISMDGMSVLKIENTNDAPLKVSLLKITNSSAIEKTYVVSYEMKYENVLQGSRWVTNESSPGRFMFPYRTTETGRLILLQNFPPSYSGRDGATQISEFDIMGTSVWKSHDIKINRTLNVGLPTQLELTLSLPTNGIVYLRPIKLLGIASSWWSQKQVGLIGGIGGSVIGCFGALLGLLASKGKARSFVLATMKIFITLGILLTIAGFVAVVSSQPYAVWYALLLPGVMLTLVFSLTLPSIQRRYDELEIRRMTSVDTMGS